jgi:hypothetical protein
VKASAPILLLLSCLPALLWSQEPAERILPIPLKYRHAPVEGISLEKSENMSLGTRWRVYGVREGASLLSQSPQASDSLIRFLQPYWVVGESEVALRLARDPEAGYDGQLSEQAQLQGWAAKEELLLWEKCLIDSNGWDRLALLIHRCDSSPLGPRQVFQDTIPVFADPNLSIPIGAQAQLLNYYYLYQVREHAVLLGTHPRIDHPEEAQRDLLGWVPRRYALLLPGRITLEPNSQAEACAERKQMRVRASVLSQPEAVASFQKQGMGQLQEVYWNADTYTQQESGNWRRFPLLARHAHHLEVAALGVVSPTSTDLSSQPQTRPFTSAVEAKARKYFQPFPSAPFHLAVRGFAPPRIDRQAHGLFRPNLLLNRSEVGELLRHTETLIRLSKAGGKAKRLQQYWLELLRRRGKKGKDKELLQLSLREASLQAFGLTSMGPTLGETRLAELKSWRKAIPASWEAYLSQLQDTREKLSQLFNARRSPHSFRSNHMTFFWLAEEYLP